MATYINHHSDLVQSIPYPVYQGPGLRIDAWGAASPADKKKPLPVSSKVQAVKDDDCIFHSLIASGAQPRPNPWASFGAVVFQSLLLLAVIVIPLYHTDLLPKRELLTMLYLQPPAAAPLGTGLRTPTHASRSTYTPTSASISSPVRRTQEDPPPSEGMIGGVIGGVPGGVVGGVPGGLLTELLSSRPSVPVAARTPDPAPVKRIRIAGRVVEANLIHDVTPIYPTEAGRARIEGTVVLLAVIGKDGSVKDVRVESGLPILAQAAIDAVKQWRYRPYMLNGEPVEVDSRITINFTLSS